MSELAKLPNVGKVLEEHLLSLGIETPEQLREIGAKEVFIRIRNQRDSGACLQMLYGIQGAVLGVPDKFLSKDIKYELRKFFKMNELSDKIMTIRKMTSDDYDGLYALWMSTPGMGLNTTDDSREGITKYLMRNPTTSFVAECDGEIVGCILCGHDGRRGYIYHTAVKASERGRGIGSALLERAMNALASEKITKVALVVFTRNEIGDRFWENRGFIQRNDLVYRNRNIIELERIDT
jgi:ribosomal protein S18 acetylase RimI-like enzyme